ncbi:Elongator complex protein 4 [Pyronema omphalodes]|nr:Elongator complex protein 4 [Pyronema omphalodes]
MSFQRRNVIINARGAPPRPGAPTTPGAASPTTPTSPASPVAPPPPPPPGTRPSPINGQPTTSTGTPSLDSLLAGHAGLPLGCSLLIEEPGTTDYGGALLRYYAAEGIVQGHAVTVVGFGDHWIRELPAVSGDAVVDEPRKNKESERMKIAWRYERLGDFGSGIGGSRAQYTPDRGPTAGDKAKVFCHAFDLTKRLSIPGSAKTAFIPPPSAAAARGTSPYANIIARLTAILSQSAPETIHRVVIPSLLNPALYPPHAAQSTYLLQFIHSLRALLRNHPKQLTIMISLPTELYPRDTGMIRWAEILSDGVIELLPLPRKTAAKDGEPQGLVKLWKLPILSEKGGGTGAQLAAGEDLAFTVSRRKFEITAYSLPPADEDEEAERAEKTGQGEGGKKTKVDLEF